MSKKNTEKKLFFRSESFDIDEFGNFSGELTYELHGDISSGTVVNAFVEFKRKGKICLISEITRCFLSESNNVLTVYSSGTIDGDALPDSYKLHYRFFRKIDSVLAKPDLPGNMGSALLSTSPKSFFGRPKWNCAGGNKIKSILVHNSDGQFLISSNVELGKNWDVINLVARYNDDDYNTYVQEDCQSPYLCLKENYVEGSEVLVCEFIFFEAEKWLELPLINNLEVQRG